MSPPLPAIAASDAVCDATASMIILRRLSAPTTASGPASPAPRSFPPAAPKIVGEFKIIPLSMAFLYQSMER